MHAGGRVRHFPPLHLSLHLRPVGNHPGSTQRNDNLTIAVPRLNFSCTGLRCLSSPIDEDSFGRDSSDEFGGKCQVNAPTLPMSRPMPPELKSSPTALYHEYQFLVPTLVSNLDLVHAVHCALTAGTLPQTMLIQQGRITADNYARALERYVAQEVGQIELADVDGLPSIEASTWINALDLQPSAIIARAVRARQQGLAALVGISDPFDARLLGLLEQERVDDAANGFSRRFSALSAATPMPTWQAFVSSILVGLVIGGSIVAPRETLFAVSAILSLLFAIIVCVRLVAIALVCGGGPIGNVRPARLGVVEAPLSQFHVPFYTVIVALYREADVLPDLADALITLDYPVSRLEVLLVLEADDHETISAAHELRLPPHFRILIVPNNLPKTKPKALNYALAAARGTYLVLYDAEDVPEPDQLKKAAQRFATGGPNLACLQARLNINNPFESWFTRGLMAQTPQEITSQFNQINERRCEM